MAATKADTLARFISLIVGAGKLDDLSDNGVIQLALDLDRDAWFLFQGAFFTVIFSDRSRLTFDQVPTPCP